MKANIQSKQDAGWLVFGALLALVGSLMTGCSFTVETGWHGKTGRDDRMQTQLVQSRPGGVRSAKDEERY